MQIVAASPRKLTAVARETIDPQGDTVLEVVVNRPIGPEPFIVLDILSSMSSRIFCLLLLTIPVRAQLAEPQRQAIDKMVSATITSRNLAGVSIAVVQNGRLAYTQAYGGARPEMRFKIGSNSKQFTAAAVLLLAEAGKLSLNDKVSKYLPNLTRANEISLRQLLSHTAGYEDYYPLDYVSPLMARDITPQGILDIYARKPLNFEPGTAWQYSNTNFIAGGLIVEKVSGQRLYDFLKKRVFVPLGMKSAIDADLQPWEKNDAAPHTKFALGPLRPVAPEGIGWLFAAGALAMNAGDLALWDISLLNGSVLKPASMKELTTEVKLKNGSGTGYALGLSVSNKDGHRRWAHGGGTSGFVSSNVTLPDDKIAITVLTNQDGPGAGPIVSEIERILLPPKADPEAAASLAGMRKLFDGLRRGELDRSMLTGDANAYFSEQVITDFTNSLREVGEVTEFSQTNMSLRGGMTSRAFSIKTATKALTLSTFEKPDGKVDQFLIYAAR